MTIRLRIAELRAAKAWTKEELSERAGVSRATIIRVEADPPPSRVDLPVLERLAAAFDVEPGFLLVRVGEEKRARGRS